ncbi:polysaccharide deacetylase family protein [Thiocystis violacea]|uniref:polysaccharide deacetylase family protein n=1 Tax=Thiocystis violacea TaxID=13725 RepID=UPI0019038095
MFRDPHGGRWKTLSRVAGVGVAFATLVLAIFLYSLLVEPRLEPLPATPEHRLAMLSGVLTATVNRPKSPAPWLTQTSAGSYAAGTSHPEPVRLGFLDDDEERALASLREHADQLTHVAPSWFQLTGMPPRLESTPSPEVAAIAAERSVGLMPILANLLGEEFDPEAVEHYLRADSAEQRALAGEIREALLAIGARGVTLVLEQIDPTYREEMVRLIGLLGSELRAAGLELWLCVPVGDDLKVFDLDALAPHVDRFVAMLYYETGEYDEAGPLASLPWFGEWLEALARHGDPSQWVIGIGTFAYDWPVNGKPELASFHDIMARAASAQAGRIANPAPYEGPHFSYTRQGVEHSVWFLDATTFRNEQRLVLEKRLGGIGIDRLGTEDPLIWKAIGCGLSCAASHFERISASDHIGMVGDGDFIEASNDQRPGQRHIQVDEAGAWGVSYIDFPRFAVVRRQGDTAPDRIALTFDDGPDPEWTPQVLDILRDEGIKAAFFVTGTHASEYPDLVRRIVAEGHEIGNHTFTHTDLSKAGPLRVKLELNATQRAIEDITGRSTLLFRPPYDADRTPHKLREITPLILAQELGYIPTMASIDPLDWQTPPAEEILERIRSARASGSVVLLHDAGGDRSATVAALPELIAYLKARGDEIVPLHRLLGVSREAVMPAIPPADPLPQRLVAGTGINLLQALENGLQVFLVLATALLFLRTLFVVWLAARRARAESREAEVSAFSPPVSVILAAYNEETVIAQTLRALLASRYPAPFEVILVDDGSTDRTAAIVAGIARAEPRLRLVSQPNRGKAAALRSALGQTRHDFIVTLDADTQFTPETIVELMKPLRDPKVGAVSGQLRVGMPTTLLGRFQALEYLAAFNLDRRALDRLNAITVVPGAASAYRAEAIRAAGGIQSDTLAEDTDLTLSLHRAGYRVRHTTRARAVTEAPRSVRGLFRQRKRWSFGTLQCLWKHRRLFCHPAYGWLGWFAIPGIWFFQIFLVALAPVVDLWLIATLLRGASGPALFYAGLFLAVDLILALVACRLDGEPARTALLVLPMRLLYRPLLSLAILSSLHRALRGSWMAWGLQERWGLARRRGEGLTS